MECEGVPAKRNVLEMFTACLPIWIYATCFEKVPLKYLFFKYLLELFLSGNPDCFMSTVQISVGKK